MPGEALKVFGGGARDDMVFKVTYVSALNSAQAEQNFPLFFFCTLFKSRALCLEFVLSTQRGVLYCIDTCLHMIALYIPS